MFYSHCHYGGKNYEGCLMIKNRLRGIEKPDLIFQANDLDLNNLPKIDSHLHTSWTDGASTVEEVYRSAIECGLETVVPPTDISASVAFLNVFRCPKASRSYDILSPS